MLLSLIAVAGMVYAGTFYVISRLPRPRRWLWVGIALSAVGGLLGVCSCCDSMSYAVSDDLKFVGFPFPVVVFQLENGRWIDFVGNPLVVVLDALLIGAAFLVPVSVALVVRAFLTPGDPFHESK